ncbi:DUF4345 domain-containing protein [Leptospira sp. 2 VSF19]|uniref:DUF4345 domain-containing protein n=1 Tax=Leptospira soteropolitanensis TaxID=2950025 RepID=A0AAW5VK31_9LEPT|nr:DUF4345 domain-containing protein [Leptospira soteropolitanensis]MCW7494311.1 DUF4345 domain-containing protein [Leptospira soteropolitanensis]MCW7501980.1 DUF4345 domain-containing protein [Leptospira soteropolitanensis]MCW7524157.1 DUF4345 domain-containing protein [Leptospira soteropolitanensis]MCW7528022.1 DUF4345 domain-containing protein [Leptospira soteropolitanensis]MCW7531876.1 DUF4345 domain-containing protein [Leptospira soteropolitanensis]
MNKKERILQILFFLVFLIGLSGGITNLIKGVSLIMPEGTAVTPYADNVYRYLAGILLGAGLIAFWVAITIRKQGDLIYVMGTAVFLSGLGRVISMITVGIPTEVRLNVYVCLELSLPIVIWILQYLRQKEKSS